MNSYAGYQQLLDHYGPQGWWPLLQRSAWPGYSAEGYHPGIYELDLGAAERFEIITGAILTQNTSWVNVRSSLVKLLQAAGHQHTSLSPEFILGLAPDELPELIRSSGYFNQKAKKLRYAAEFLISIDSGADFHGTTSAATAHSKTPGDAPSRGELLSIWGIGPETADSILLYAYNQPVCVVDAYSIRIFKRLSGDTSGRKWSYEELQATFHGELPRDAWVYNEFHGLLVEHAKQHCTSKNPKCDKCPLKTMCKFLAQIW